MEISKFGFADVISPSRVVLYPSRVAAQVHSVETRTDGAGSE